MRPLDRQRNRDGQRDGEAVRQTEGQRLTERDGQTVRQTEEQRRAERRTDR